MSKTDVLYLRVPSWLKEFIDRYAEESGLSLTEATKELIGIGMQTLEREATSNERS